MGHNFFGVVAGITLKRKRLPAHPLSGRRQFGAKRLPGIHLCHPTGARVLGILGKDGGYTATQADACVIIPTVNPNNITPHSEAFQAVVWHLFVSHPSLKVNQTKWESVTTKNTP